MPWLAIGIVGVVTGSQWGHQAVSSQMVPQAMLAQQQGQLAPVPMTLAADMRMPAAGAMRARPVLVMLGQASWYSKEDPGINPQTANGEPFDDGQLTCAIWNLPFDTRVHVTNLNTGRHVIVRVNDRGPARRLVAEGRVIDLSKAAFREIGDLREGLIPVRVELLPVE